VEVLQRITTLYDSDRETIEIRKTLDDEYAFEVEEINEYDTTTYPPAYDVSGKLDEYQQRQEDFNKQLLEQLNQQQKYIVKLVERSNEDVKELKRLISPE